MAKKPATTTSENLPATIEERLPSTDLAPDFLKDYTGPLGTENIDTKDVNIPRLKLAQGLTPEVKDGLVKDGDLFHSITKQVLIRFGDTGIIVPVAYFKEYILWRDRKDGGGIFARAKRVVLENGAVRYAWDKPNQTFETKLGGIQKVRWQTKEFIEQDGLAEFGSAIPGDKDSLPAATAHYNYVLYMPEHDGALVAVSFSRTAAKKAKDFNAMLKMGNAPMFVRRFNLGAVQEQNDKGDKFANYAMTPAGFIQDVATFNHLRDLHVSMSESGVNVDFADEEAAAANHGTAEDQERF